VELGIVLQAKFEGTRDLKKRKRKKRGRRRGIRGRIGEGEEQE